MEGDLEQRSGAQSRVSSAASSQVNKEDEEADEVKASPTSLVSSQAYSRVFGTSRTHYIDVFVAKQGYCFS